MTAPFVILSLPRSRSAWLARFLSYGGRKCGHDLATTVGSMMEFAGLFESNGYDGTAETGAVVGWQAILRVIPGVRFVVVRRPIDEVYRSLSRFGLASSLLMDELRDRDAMLDEVARLPGVRSFSFDNLRGIDVCRDIFEHCLGIPFDWEWWEGLATENVQVDVPQRVQYLIDNADRIAELKRNAAQIVEKSPAVVLGPESWESVWPEIDALFSEHFGEVEGDLVEHRPYKADEPAMRALYAAGTLRIFTARVNGDLAGYCMWQVTKDVESLGLLIAQHGPWFVRKKYGHLMLGGRLFDASIADLRGLGVKIAFPHHRLQGRSVKLGAFFRRRGAVETQRTYTMWLGEPQHA